jgi:hypothetical protein
VATRSGSLDEYSKTLLRQGVEDPEMQRRHQIFLMVPQSSSWRTRVRLKSPGFAQLVVMVERNKSNERNRSGAMSSP